MKNHLFRISLIWAICVSACLSQVETLIAKHGEVFALSTDLAGDVKWIVYQPLDLKYLMLFDADAKPVIVFTPPSGESSAVIEADVVDWDAKKRSSKRWVIQFGEPVPPKPEPDNPEPEPPNPDVEDGYLGLTKLVAGQPIKKSYRYYAEKLAANFVEVAEGLAPGDSQKPAKYGTIDQAMADLKKVNNDILIDPTAKSEWLPCMVAVNSTIQQAWPLTRYQMADALRAVAKGMEHIR